MRTTSGAKQSETSCSRPASTSQADLTTSGEPSARCCEAPTDVESYLCTLTGEEVTEVAELLATVAGYSIEPPRRTANGYSLRLAASEDAKAALSDFVRRDEMCCSFLKFDVAEDPGQFCLDVSGPADAAPLLDLCFVAAQHGASSSSGESA